MHLCEVLQNTYKKSHSAKERGFVHHSIVTPNNSTGNVCKTKEMHQIKCSLGLDLTKFSLSFVLQAKFWHVWSLEVFLFANM